MVEHFERTASEVGGLKESQLLAGGVAKGGGGKGGGVVGETGFAAGHVEKRLDLIGEDALAGHAGAES